jgi:hypothetical protein
MVAVTCIEAPQIPEKFLQNLPGMGELQLLRDSLDELPRPSEYILKLLNSMAPALAPINSLLRVLDVLVAITNCVKSIPEAIFSFNPEPVFNCLSELFQALAALAPLVPPLSYIRMVVDIVSNLRFLVEDIVQTIGLIDAEITRIANVIAKAQATNDANLVQIGNCAMNDINQGVGGIMQILEGVTKFMKIVTNILEFMAAVIPGDAGEDIQKIVDEINGVDEELNQIDLTGLPPLQYILDALMLLRNVLLFIESWGKAILGLQFIREDFQPPELVNPGT